MAPGHVLICVSHCGLHFPSIFFLFSPLPFVRLVLLSIWPTIDKTQSLTMLGTQRRIGGSGAHALWRACVCSVRALGRRWDASHIIVYLPFYFQMALSRKNVVLDTHPLSIPLSFPLLGSVLHLSRGSLCCFGVGFRSRTRSVR